MSLCRPEDLKNFIIDAPFPPPSKPASKIILMKILSTFSILITYKITVGKVESKDPDVTKCCLILQERAKKAAGTTTTLTTTLGKIGGALTSTMVVGEAKTISPGPGVQMVLTKYEINQL
jgi:hypothetical protein